MSRGDRKFAGLELCRFICSFTVVLNHYRYVAPEASKFWPTNEGILHTSCTMILSIAYVYGDLAVQVFWVISGFIFFLKYSKSINDNNISFMTFFIYRLSRLYPLHLATLITVALMQWIYFQQHGEPFIFGPNDIEHFFYQLLFSSNWLTGVITFNGPIWSVSAEVVAYFVFFIVMSNFKPTLILCALFVTVTFWFHQPVLTCIEFFFAGGMLQIIIRQLDLEQRKFAFLASVAVIVVVVVASEWFLPLNGASVLFLAVAIVAAFGLLEAALSADLSSFTLLGIITYSSYLMAFPIQLAVVLLFDYIDINRAVYYSPIVLSLMLVTTFGFAYLVYTYFEAPAQNAIRLIYRAALERQCGHKLLDE